jgi:hypothetical protein
MKFAFDLRHPAKAGPLLLLPLFLLALWLMPARNVDASLRCKLYNWRNQEVRYQTSYRYDEAETRTARQKYKPLPAKGVYAIAKLYVIEPDSAETRPCSNLTIKKKLFLQRRDDPDFVLSEISEFYAEDGTLITTNRQAITDQIQHSGYYMAHDPLPIPEDVPPGRYQLLTKLVLTKKGRKRVFLLGSTKTEYRILPFD